METKNFINLKLTIYYFTLQLGIQFHSSRKIFTHYSHEFKLIKVARFSGRRLYRRVDITNPAFENTRSQGEELAGKISISQNNFGYRENYVVLLATKYNPGYSFLI